MLSIVLLFVLAAINFLAAAAFAWARNWPWAVTYLGGFVILVGQIWAVMRDV